MKEEWFKTEYTPKFKLLTTKCKFNVKRFGETVSKEYLSRIKINEVER